MSVELEVSLCVNSACQQSELATYTDFVGIFKYHCLVMTFRKQMEQTKHLGKKKKHNENIWVYVGFKIISYHFENAPFSNVDILYVTGLNLRQSTAFILVKFYVTPWSQ